MPIKKMAQVVNNLITNIAVWDGVSTWNPGTPTTEVTSTSYKFGDAIHVRNGNTYTHNVIIDGNSMSVGTAGGSSVIAVNQGVLDAGLTQWDLINVATNGLTTPQLTTRAPTQVDPLYESSLGNKNILIIWEGTNDIAAGSTDVQAYNNIKSYCQARKTACPLIKIIVGTVTPRAGWNGTQQGYRTSLNTMIRNAKIANETWLDAVADVGGDATIGGATNGTYYLDGLHLNTAGSNIAKVYFKNAILGLL